MWMIKDALGRFWQRGLGWTEDRALATDFTSEETSKLPLPPGGNWLYESAEAQVA